VVLLFYRYKHSEQVSGIPLKVTTWDAFGYYMYLPAYFIYNDNTQYNWIPSIDSTYQILGSSFYQVQTIENGNKVCKYSGGVALMQLPWFIVGHTIAKNTNFKPDGFSAPYQYSIAFGVIVYCILALFILRKVLLRYYSDNVTSFTLLALILTTNAIQYISVDGGQSHAHLFPLYALILFASIKWHEKPSWLWACVIGFTIGLATVSRPTELIMMFIPLFWKANNKTELKQKIELIKTHKSQLIAVAFFAFIAALPQLVYWQHVTGFFFHTMGSKWYFLTPFFRVLFGFTNGWFVYTPITILFVIGLFMIKSKPFYRSVLVFCLANIWIVIAWSDWRYGGTYSTRALMQSYPVFALALGEVFRRISTNKKIRILALVILSGLVYLNLFQMKQYCNGVLHFRDMNYSYYKAIFLNMYPTPEQFSLMDNTDYLSEEIPKEFSLRIDSTFSQFSNKPFYAHELPKQIESCTWLKVQFKAKPNQALAPTFFKSTLGKNKYNQIRLHRAYARVNQWNDYAYYIELPERFSAKDITFELDSDHMFDGEITELWITGFSNKN
jgi:hypothetical protein